MRVYELNGFYYIKDCDAYYDWLSDQDNVPYFHLNNVTRQKFIQDILPLIKSGQCTCDKKVLDKIRYFDQAPKRNLPEPLVLIEPDPINKPLMPHQIESVTRMVTYPKYGFFLGTGTGKTLIAISFLMTMEIKKALIVTPKKVIDQYKTELDKYIPDNKCVVINYEQVINYVDQDFDALILDESHRAKNYSSQISANIKQISQKTPNVYLFTGTPQDKQRHEIMAQLYLLYDHFMPGKTRFINRYFNLDDYYKPKSEKRDFSKELTNMIESISWGKETDDVVDLSACPENEIIIQCPRPDPLYYQLGEDKVLEFPDGSVVVADGKALLKIKQREMCCGFVRVERGTQKGTKRIFNPKDQQARKFLPTIDKAIIYTEFKRDMQNLSKICDDLKLNYAIVDGSTSKKNADSYIKGFKDGTIRFLIMQSKSGNAGLDFTCTNNVIFYALPESYIVFKQCKGRIRRPGQTKVCNYYYFICEDSLEKDMIQSLKRKKSFTTRVFKIYK